MNSTPLSLTIKYTQIRQVICVQGWGLFLPLVGQWSLLIFPISSNSLCLIGEMLQLADSMVHLFLSLLSRLCLFFRTLFRVVFLHKSQSHAGVERCWNPCVYKSACLTYIFNIPFYIQENTQHEVQSIWVLYIEGKNYLKTEHFQVFWSAVLKYSAAALCRP